MHKFFAIGILGLFVFSQNLAFAESIYHISLDEHSFELEYEFNGNVIAMALDQELFSLLIGIENTKDSLFLIKLPNEMIKAENNEFAVLVDGLEVGYELNPIDDSMSLTFFVPENSQEIEIIGTYVIPEFPLSMLSVFVVTVTMVLVITKSIKNLRYNLF